jgi:hypothetical protein
MKHTNYKNPLCNFLYPALNVISSFLIISSSLGSSIRNKDLTFTHVYKQAKCIYSYIVAFRFSDRKLDYPELNCSQYSQNLICY